MLRMSRFPKSRKIATTVLAAVCAASMLAACGSPASSQNEAKGDDITVGVFTGSLADLPILVAQEQNIFSKNGLNVTTTPVSGGAAASAGLVSSQFDVVASSGSNAFVFNEKAAASNSKQRMIAVVNEVSGPYFVVLARKESNPPPTSASLKDRLVWLSKQRVGVSARGAETENIVRGMMVTNGVNPDSATWIAAGDPTSSLSAWTGGRVDAMVSWQPAQQKIEDTGDSVDLVNFLDLRKTDPIFEKGWSTNTWWTSSSFAEKNSTKLEKFSKSVSEAITYINDPANKQNVISMFAKKYNVDSAVVTKAFDAWKGVYTPDLTCAAFDNAQAFYKSVGIIKQEQPCSDITWNASPYVKGLK